MLRESVTDLRRRSHLVVGQHLDVDRNPSGTVAFVDYILVGDSWKLARPLHDRSFDIVRRHVGGLRLGDSRSQSRGAVRVTATHFRSDGQLLDDSRKDLAPLSVEGGLFVLDGAPLAMAGHTRAPV